MTSPSPRRVNDTSPARRLLKENNRRSFVHGHPLPLRDGNDSPSRQLVAEFGRLLIDQDQQLQQELDNQIEKQAALHRNALAHAAAEHERIRRNAEIARERVELEIEREKKRREAEERQRLERERQAKVARESQERQWEQERIQREQREQTERAAEQRRIEEDRARLESQRRQEDEDAANRKREAEESAKNRAREAAANAAKAREEAQKAEAAKHQTTAPLHTQQPAAAPVSAATVSQAPTTQPTSTNPLQEEFELVHKRYLEAHKRLKEMRQYVLTESKKIPALKTKLGDWRREIVKCMGQLTADKQMNRRPMNQIMAVLQDSLKHTNPSVDASTYLISVPHPSPGSPIPLSGTFLYLLSIFAKSVVAQFISESSGGAKAADPVGVVAVSVFATPAFKLAQTVPLVDVLLAKFHLVCPLLFCISGPSNSAAGRARLGWWREGGGFVPEQRHLERMAGLATGWAALTLRDFSKSKNENPLPNWYYWRALAGVANVDSKEFGGSHATVLKGLIEGFVPRFVGFYGWAAKAALRSALVEVPDRMRREAGGDKEKERAVKGLEVLREVLGRDLKISFD